MDISIIKALPDDVVKALCNTLIHSLWQGLILAAVAGLIVIFTRKATSAARYKLLVAALVLFTCSVVYTFAGQLHLAQAFVVKPDAINPAVMHTPFVNLTPVAIHQSSFTENLVAYFNNHAAIIVMIWLLVVCARSIQLLTGLHGLYHLRRRSILLTDTTWQDRVGKLSVKLGIDRIVGIAESGLAKVPMVIGHIKPMILIPIGLITTLSPAEIDAILVHELAHIRRRDYLVNLLQSLMEIIFFFNPAVLWISALIKAERENCCDDIALEETGNKAGYIKALVICQEFQMNAPAYAMAFSGNKGSLLGRVKRMVSNNNQSLNTVEKSLLAICLLTAGVLTTAFSNADKISKIVTTTTTSISKAIRTEISPEKEKPEAAPVAPIDSIAEIVPDVEAPADTSRLKLKIYSIADLGDKTSVQVLNNGFVSYLNKQDGKLYQINLDGGILLSVQVDGKTLSKDEMAASYGMIDKMVYDQDSKLARQKDKLSAMDARLGVMNSELGTREAFKDGEVAKVNASIKASMARELKYVSEIDSIIQSQKAKSPEAHVKPYTTKANEYLGKAAEYKANANKNDSLRNSIISQLTAEGIIRNSDKLSFKLSTNEFIVNGKKQPDDIYQKYRSQYVKVTGHNEWSWYYNFDTGTQTEQKTTTTIK